MKTEYDKALLGDEDMELRLWEYIDGLTAPSELSAIEKLIAENIEWRAKYHELLEVHQLIATTELEQPSLRFTKNVMEEISNYNIAPATKEYINKKIIWAIAAFFITAIVSFVIYSFSQVDWSVADNTPLPFKVPKMDFSSLFTNTFINGFMMLNVILGLMLLDKYLANKKNKLIEQA